jgi:hypothetical protein
MAQHGGARKNAGRKPGAVSKAKRELAEMAKDHAQKALAVLAEIMETGESDAARVSAANSILDRGYGRPFQALHHAGHDGEALPSIDPTKLSQSAMRELLLAMRDDEAPDADAG